MTEQKPLSLIPAVLVAVTTLLFLGVYFGGYLWLSGDPWWDLTAVPPKMGRGYDWAWQAAVFKPAGLLERQIRGIEVEVYQFTAPMEAPAQ